MANRQGDGANTSRDGADRARSKRDGAGLSVSFAYGSQNCAGRMQLCVFRRFASRRYRAEHDQQSGTVRTVCSVSTRKSTRVVLGECIETHARIPISFYKFDRIGPPRSLDGLEPRDGR